MNFASAAGFAVLVSALHLASPAGVLLVNAHADTETPPIRVVSLRHAVASDLAALLDQMQRAVQGTGAGQAAESSRAQGSPGNAAGGAMERRAIVADRATNSLLLFGPRVWQAEMERVIAALDARQPQVLVEAIIIELTKEEEAALGIQWQIPNLPGASQAQLYGGTNLSGGSLPSIAQVSANPAGAGAGLNLGISAGTLRIPDGKGGQTSLLSLFYLVQAIQSKGVSGALSSPTLMSMGGEEARIIVGQNVPVVSARAQTGLNQPPSQAIERKDVGIILQVKPRVTGTGAVALRIIQEVSSIADTSLSAGLITSLRRIETNVLAEDGQVIVLGGLLQETLSESSKKVPGLHSLPLIGNQFASDSRKALKTNLLLFIRPVVTNR